MTQDFQTKNPTSNVAEYSVTEISTALRQTVEGTFSHVRVRGEISRPRKPGSGHLYLALKDAQSVLDAVCWRGTVARLPIRPEEGMEVVCTGRLTTYAGQSKYQLIIESMELAGEGALLKLLEDRKRRLAAEGVFDGDRKRPLPYLPTVIGVVTSPTGAVIRDILHRLADRFPRHVLIWPVPVQGEGAAVRIAAAIAGFNTLNAIGGGNAGSGRPVRPDVLIIARGGGSLEDLMAFNEEVVVRAVAASTIPVISAVGHETDTTLIDLVADRRAPTPTAAAEMAVPVRSDLLAGVLDRAARLEAGMARLMEDRRFRLGAAERALGDPARLWEGVAQRLDDRSERLDRAMTVSIERRQAHVARAAAAIPHPRQTLREISRRLSDVARRQRIAGHLALRRLSDDLARHGGRLTAAPLQRSIDSRRERLDDVSGRFARAGETALAAAVGRLETQAKLLESYSYKKTLERGFVVIRGGDGAAITEPDALDAGDRVWIEYREGRKVAAEITGDAEPGKGVRKTARSRKTSGQSREPKQGQLL